MKNKHKKALLSVLPLLAALSAGAQTDPVYISGQVYVSGADKVQLYGDTKLDSTAKLFVKEGKTVTFYGQQFKMKPGAQVLSIDSASKVITPGAGTGSITFAQVPGSKRTVQQELDGGNNTLTSVVINNDKGVKLVNSNTRVGTNVSFAKGHLYTDAQDMVLASAATMSNYDATKYVVTNVGNAAGGHLVKESYTGSFEFPVGMADGDYTPAVITPATANTVHVNVTDYNSSTPMESFSEGVQRSWNIYGENNGAAKVALQHNTATNQDRFAADANFVTRGSVGSSETGVPAKSIRGTVAGSEELSRDFSAMPTSGDADDAYFTKASNARQTGVDAISGNAAIVAAPNPTRGVITVSGLAAGQKVLVNDVTGRQLGMYPVSGNALTVDLGNYATGTYALSVLDANSNLLQTVKVVKAD